MKFTCTCCGFKTLDDAAGGTYEICELCGWEDDAVQSGDPDYEGGANGICLREAQYEFVNSGADSGEYVKDADWQLLQPPSRESKLRNSKTDYIVNTKGVAKNA